MTEMHLSFWPPDTPGIIPR